MRKKLYVQDVDIWTLKLPSSVDVASYVELMKHDFITWDRLVTDMENPVVREEIVKNGALLNRYKDSEIEDMIKHDAQIVEFEGFSEIIAKSILWGQKPISLIKYNYDRESLFKVLNKYPWNQRLQ